MSNLYLFIAALNWQVDLLSSSTHGVAMGFQQQDDYAPTDYPSHDKMNPQEWDTLVPQTTQTTDWARKYYWISITCSLLSFLLTPLTTVVPLYLWWLKIYQTSFSSQSWSTHGPLFVASLVCNISALGWALFWISFAVEEGAPGALFLLLAPLIMVMVQQLIVPPLNPSCLLGYWG